MTLKNEENFIWKFGLGNALIFIQTAWKYTSNFQILLNETCFHNQLNIHISIYDAEIVNKEEKKQNFQNLKLSKWEKRDTVFSALAYIFKKDVENNVILSNIRFYIRDQIPYICDEVYSYDIIKLYKKFHFFQFYPDKCILGCQDVFISSQYSSKHSFYLNHIGLQNYLGELNINVTTFSKIKIFCNENQNFDFFVLFLQNYKFNNSTIFLKQVEYDYLITTIQLFTSKNSSDFIDCNYLDYDSFYLEFNKIEQQRIFTLVRIHLQKKKKVVKQKSKEILIYVCNSKLMKYTGAFLLFSFILWRHTAESAFAMQSSSNPRGVSVRGAHPTEGTYSEASSTTRKRNRFAAPYYLTGNPNTSITYATPEVEAREHGVRYFKKLAAKMSDKKKKNALIELAKAMKSVVIDTIRPSDASSDVNSNVPLNENVLYLYRTKCRIVGGRLHNNALSKKITANSLFDKMVIPESFTKFPNKSSVLNRTIYRAEIKPEKVKNFSGQSYFVIFYPVGTKGYIVTLCGNVGQSEDLKEVAKLVQAALQKDAKYQYGGMTFEHAVPHTYNEALDIGRTDRSNTKDTSYGLSIGDSLNKRMGHSQADISKVYDKNNKNMFSESEKKIFPGIILEQFYEKCVKMGEKRTQEICDKKITKSVNSAAQKVRQKLKPTKYDKLSIPEQEKAVNKECYKAANEEVSSYKFQQNPFFDTDVSPLYRHNYKKVHDLHREKVNRYTKELGIEKTQTSTCFFVDVLLIKSQSNLSTEYKSIEYQQPRGNIKKLPCPIENSAQELQRQSHYCEAVELICKQAAIRWPDDLPLQRALKQRKYKLLFLNESFLARSKTNLNMVQELDMNSLNYYKKKTSTPIVQEENQEIIDNTVDNDIVATDSVATDIVTTDIVATDIVTTDSVATDSVATDSVATDSVASDSVASEIEETNWERIQPPKQYTAPLEEELTKFENSYKQSEQHLVFPREGETDYGFIKSENKNFNAQDTHNFLFRQNRTVNLNTAKISSSCTPTRFIDSLYFEKLFDYSAAQESVTPAAASVGQLKTTISSSPSSTGAIPPGPSSAG